MQAPNASYWNEYTNFQHIKHRLIREYLNGWFPKLGYWAGRIVYIDTHAGRGEHKGGQEGSPIVALKTFLNHRAREKILTNSELVLFFIELDPQNANQLRTRLENSDLSHPNIHWHIIENDAFQFLESLADDLDREEKSLAPSFMFIDPYGYRIPYTTLRRLKQHPRSELLINVMWRELDMAIMNPSLESTLNAMFGSTEWQTVRKIENSNERAEHVVQLLRRQVGSRWATYIRMVDNNRTRYFLLHLTDHTKGRDLMKIVVWKCCPDGGFYIRKQDDPKQQYLIVPEPDLRPLEDWLIRLLSVGPQRWSTLEQFLREEIWLPKHLWEIVRKLRKAKRIVADGYSGKFSRKANPILTLMES